MISERLDISNEKCKPMFGFLHGFNCGFSSRNLRVQTPAQILDFSFQSLRSTKHELFSAADFDGVIGGVFFILFP